MDSLDTKTGTPSRGSRSPLSIPDQHAVSIDFPDPVKRDSDYLPFRGMQIKREAVSRFELKLLQRNPDYFSQGVIEIADLEAAPAEVLIPADPV